METAFTRVVLPMPIFVLPPIIMSYLERFVQKYIVGFFFKQLGLQVTITVIIDTEYFFLIKWLIFWSVKCENMKNISTQYDKISGFQFIWPPLWTF